MPFSIDFIGYILYLRGGGCQVGLGKMTARTGIFGGIVAGLGGISPRPLFERGIMDIR
jgi:hypothetical protein